MASCLFSPTSLCYFPNYQPKVLVFKRSQTKILVLHKPIQCISNTNLRESLLVIRRSGNYQPCIWDNDFLQSLHNNYKGAIYERKAENLKENVRVMLNDVEKPLEQLELIDVLQRLGLAYQFEKEINDILKKIKNRINDHYLKRDNLYATSLEFRLLRQHGVDVSQEVFNNFRDKMGSFKECLCCDIKGMLSLYEASYYALEGEAIMEEAWNFTAKHLKAADELGIDPILSTQVRHALELPLHWRMSKLEARWSIDVYERKGDLNPLLLELAKLDFNIVQGMYQEELKETSRWWNNTGLGEKLSFVRNRLVPSFLWSVGITCDPQNGYARKILTRTIQLITAIDDIYDVYGTLEELELFTNAVERWEISAMKQLPDYMKICFLALFNSVNEMAYVALKEQGCDIVAHLKQSWVDLLKSYLVEAKWYHSGYKPTFEEYMSNAWVSITGPLIAVQGYLFVAKPIKQETVQFIESEPDVLFWSSVIFRILDDFGTSPHELERGDVPKSLQCYMNETGASEEDARQHMRDVVREAWKKVNRHRHEKCPSSQSCINIMLDLTRMAQCMYQYGDGHAVEEGDTKNRATSLIFEPIPL